MAEDPNTVLERLHNELVKAGAEADAVLAEWRTGWVDLELLDRYSVAEKKALRLARALAAYRKTHRPFLRPSGAFTGYTTCDAPHTEPVPDTSAAKPK